MINLFDHLDERADEEVRTEIVLRKDVRIEQIVSTGQSTPLDKPHRQKHDEWVLLLAGSAGLRIEGEEERSLGPGDTFWSRRTGRIGSPGRQRTSLLSGSRYTSDHLVGAARKPKNSNDAHDILKFGDFSSR
jgi:hypothetical protein